MITFYVKCPDCKTILQKKRPNPRIAIIICDKCQKRFQAYGHIEEEEDP